MLLSIKILDLRGFQLASLSYRAALSVLLSLSLSFLILHIYMMSTDSLGQNSSSESREAFRARAQSGVLLAGGARYPPRRIPRSAYFRPPCYVPRERYIFRKMKRTLFTMIDISPGADDEILCTAVIANVWGELMK